jgi:hypothetical protein
MTRRKQMGSITTAFYYVILWGILYGIAKILSEYWERKWVRGISLSSIVIILFLLL